LTKQKKDRDSQKLSYPYYDKWINKEI
jgi:hypothetical protein